MSGQGELDFLRPTNDVERQLTERVRGLAARVEKLTDDRNFYHAWADMLADKVSRLENKLKEMDDGWPNQINAYVSPAMTYLHEKRERR